jgi:hypothetical protein
MVVVDIVLAALSAVAMMGGVMIHNVPVAGGAAGGFVYFALTAIHDMLREEKHERP